MSSKGGASSGFRLAAGQLYWGTTLVSLTPTERAVLTALAAAAPAPVAAGDLIAAAWGDAPVGSESLHRCISTIRRKLAQVHDGTSITTHNRTGYSLAVPIAREAHGPATAQLTELVRQAMELAAGRTRPGMEGALGRLDHAIAADPDFLPALQLKVHALVTMAMHRYAAPRGLGEALIKLSERILARYPRSADALAGRGFARAVVFGEAAGLEDLDRAVALEPANWLCRLYRAWALTGQGHFTAAKADLDEAWAQNPAGSGLVGPYAYLHFCGGDPEKALTVLRQAGDAMRFMASAQAAHAAVASWLGHHGEAVAAGRRAAEVLDGSPTLAASLCYALARAGEETEARRLLAAIEARQDVLAAPAMLAPAHMALSAPDKARQALAAAEAELCVYRHVQAHDPRLKDAVTAALPPRRR